MINLQNKLGYTFLNQNLLQQALTHLSYAREKNAEDNERLEFLGDSLLDVVIGSFLFRQYPDFDEGKLSQSRSRIVMKGALFEIAMKYDIGQYLRLGKGEELTGGREKASNLANAVEAIIGAIFLDSNYESMEKAVLSIFKDELLEAECIENPKGKLQEVCDRNNSGKLSYQVVLHDGPDHRKIFTVEVSLKKRLLGTGSGTSKQRAEQAAADEVLKNIFDNKNEESKIDIN